MNKEQYRMLIRRLRGEDLHVTADKDECMILENAFHALTEEQRNGNAYILKRSIISYLLEHGHSSDDIIKITACTKQLVQDVIEMKEEEIEEKIKKKKTVNIAFRCSSGMRFGYIREREG